MIFLCVFFVAKMNESTLILDMVGEQERETHVVTHCIFFHSVSLCVYQR